MAEYTPGSWRISRSGLWPSIRASRESIASLASSRRHGPERAMANARLIAAAPALLAALQGCVLRLEMDDAPCANETLAMAYAAIAKALGQEVAP